MNPIRIMIADDHPIFRFGMRALLTAQPDMQVVGEATNGDEVLALIAPTQPDIVLMDITMSYSDGIAATQQISARHPQVGVLIVTMLEDEGVFAALRARARGYLLKGGEPDEALRAIRAVAHGEVIFSPGVAAQVLHFFQHSPRQHAPTTLPELTEREREVLSFIGQGLTNNAIAQRLTFSPNTVRNYITEIFGKLQVPDRAAAIIRARDAGLR